jgi:putative ABC transport system permease protein
MNYFLFAFRNLRKKGIRSWLTLLGVFIGIMAVVSLISLGNAMKVAVTSQFGESATEVIGVQAGGLQYSGIPGSDVVTPLTKDDVRAIDRLGSVEFAIGRNMQTVSVEYNDKFEVGLVYSVTEGYEKEIYETIDDIKPESGRLLKSGDSGKVFLGKGYEDGDKNGFDKDITPGKSILINGKNFQVVGILKKKGSFMYDNTIFMYSKDLDSLVGNGEEVDAIQVKVKNKDLVDKAKTDIEKLLRQRRNVGVGEEDFQVSTAESTMKTINSALGAIQAFIIIIASISIAIGAIGIINSMTTSVLERRKEIGIMKSIGARNSQIFMQFFIESGFLGLAGGIFGTLFGVLIGYIGTWGINTWLGSETKPVIDFFLIFFALLGSFVIGSIAGVFPAMKAAKQNPVQALRG